MMLATDLKLAPPYESIATKSIGAVLSCLRDSLTNDRTPFEAKSAQTLAMASLDIGLLVRKVKGELGSEASPASVDEALTQLLLRNVGLALSSAQGILQKASLPGERLPSRLTQAVAILDLQRKLNQMESAQNELEKKFPIVDEASARRGLIFQSAEFPQPAFRLTNEAILESGWLATSVHSLLSESISRLNQEVEQALNDQNFVGVLREIEADILDVKQHASVVFDHVRYLEGDFLSGFARLPSEEVWKPFLIVMEQFEREVKNLLILAENIGGHDTKELLSGLAQVSDDVTAQIEKHIENRCRISERLFSDQVLIPVDTASAKRLNVALTGGEELLISVSELKALLSAGISTEDLVVPIDTLLSNADFSGPTVEAKHFLHFPLAEILTGNAASAFDDKIVIYPTDDFVKLANVHVTTIEDTASRSECRDAGSRRSTSSLTAFAEILRKMDPVDGQISVTSVSGLDSHNPGRPKITISLHAIA